MTNIDEVFDTFANAQRRRLLIHMLEHNPEDDTKAYIGDMDVDDGELEELLMQMTHIHLPKLEADGFINWDKEEHVVTKGPNFDEIRPLVELLNNHEDELPNGWL
ncbi:ArsR family transcriptional regulator [Natrinema versiforme]|uniref:ArsR family transcriptional regulator n=1 Tax=Natrinema versiforme TaxID=88724 RepID=UPI001EF9CAF6|nr:ArsR family transcriptional regulator [Natrinema versiforme]